MERCEQARAWSQTGRALDALQMAISFCPDNMVDLKVKLLCRSATMLFEAEWYEEALEIGKAAIQLKPDHSKVWPCSSNSQKGSV